MKTIFTQGGAMGPHWIIQDHGGNEIGRLYGADDSTLEAITKALQMQDALTEALPVIETAELDPAYKPGTIRKLSNKIRNLIS